MSYYWFNREELLNKARDRYYNKGGKEKAAKYNWEDIEDLREDSINMYRNLSDNERRKKRICKK